MSLRMRLIVTIVALLVGALAIFDVAVYTAFSRAVFEEFEDELRVRAAEVASQLNLDGDTSLDAEDIRPGMLEPASLENDIEPGVYVQVLDQAGRVIATSGTRLPTDRSQVRRALTGVEVIGLVGSDSSVRVLSRPVLGPDGRVIGLVQAGQSTQLVDATLESIGRLLIIGTLVTIGAAGLIGWLLIGPALSPVRRVIAAANRIVATGHLGERIPPSSMGDEIGVLVRSFNQMIERLDRAFEQQRQLVADTSHELRNPLMAIGANLEIIERSEDMDDHYEAAAEAKAEVARMSRLVSDLLLLGQADDGQLLEHKVVDVVQLVARVVERARRLFPDHVIAASSPTSALLSGDPDRLQQAVWNLVENAARYTPAGGRITIATAVAGGRVRIDVDDTGVGIAPDHQAHVFERFYRVDTARSRRSGGSGLGLAIVKYVVDAHGGTVSVSSQPGAGTRFSLSFPATMTTSEAPVKAKLLASA
jgi:two-component system OmpR family sensor kinase